MRTIPSRAVGAFEVLCCEIRSIAAVFELEVLHCKIVVETRINCCVRIVGVASSESMCMLPYGKVGCTTTMCDSVQFIPCKLAVSVPSLWTSFFCLGTILVASS